MYESQRSTFHAERRCISGISGSPWNYIKHNAFAYPGGLEDGPYGQSKCRCWLHVQLEYFQALVSSSVGHCFYPGVCMQEGQSVGHCLYIMHIYAFCIVTLVENWLPPFFGWSDIAPHFDSFYQFPLVIRLKNRNFLLYGPWVSLAAAQR